jgi:hypothetical protein
MDSRGYSRYCTIEVAPLQKDVRNSTGTFGHRLILGDFEKKLPD